METDADISALVPRVYEVVRLVPYGQVTTYGDVAHIVGDGCDARLVGAAMAMVKDESVPWQRVVNAKGAISTRADLAMVLQRTRLEAEGVLFDERGRIDLARFSWRGPDTVWAAQHGYRTLSALADNPTQPPLL